MLVPDVSSTINSTELVRALKSDGIQAYADFPLNTPEGQIGFLSVFYRRPHRFPVEEVELLETVAAEAALAVANARLHATTDQKLARRVHQLTILEAVGRELSAAAHSERLFRLILEHALDYTGAPWGAIGVYSAEKNALDMKATRGYAFTEPFPADQGITGRAIRKNDPKTLETHGKTPTTSPYWNVKRCQF